MSDLRAACIHGRYEKHEIYPNVGIYYDDTTEPCLGGRDITIDRRAMQNGFIAHASDQLHPHFSMTAIDDALDRALAAAIGDTDE